MATFNDELTKEPIKRELLLDQLDWPPIPEPRKLVRVFEQEAITGVPANRALGPLGIEIRQTRGRLLPPIKDDTEAYLAG